MIHPTIRRALAVMASLGAALTLGSVAASAQTPSASCSLGASNSGGSGSCSTDLGVAQIQGAGGSLNLPNIGNVAGLPTPSVSTACNVNASVQSQSTASCSASVSAAGTGAQVSTGQVTVPSPGA